MSAGFFGMPQSFGQAGRRQVEADMAKRQAASHARKARSYAAETERRLDKLTIICMALWSLLSEKLQLTEEDLMERVKTIDLMDGEVDGKIKRTLAKCSKCGRVMSPRHNRCLYCGADRLQITAFDDVV